jgi:serine protease Do
MVVETVPAENLERYGINGGVVVRKVAPGSAASEAGIRVGDVITLIDTTPIKSMKTFEQAVEGLKGGSSVPLRLIRQGAPLFIGLKVPG